MFDLIGLGAAPNLNKQQAFKKYVFLPMMLNQTFTFRRIFYKKIAPHSSF